MPSPLYSEENASSFAASEKTATISRVSVQYLLEPNGYKPDSRSEREKRLICKTSRSGSAYQRQNHAVFSLRAGKRSSRRLFRFTNNKQPNRSGATAAFRYIPRYNAKANGERSLASPLIAFRASWFRFVTKGSRLKQSAIAALNRITDNRVQLSV